MTFTTDPSTWVQLDRMADDGCPLSDAAADVERDFEELARDVNAA